eukprot:2466146-Pleurochrysis_carterae.AAC.1
MRRACVNDGTASKKPSTHGFLRVYERDGASTHLTSAHTADYTLKSRHANFSQYSGKRLNHATLTLPGERGSVWEDLEGRLPNRAHRQTERRPQPSAAPTRPSRARRARARWRQTAARAPRAPVPTKRAKKPVESARKSRSKAREKAGRKRAKKPAASARKGTTLLARKSRGSTRFT